MWRPTTTGQNLRQTKFPKLRRKRIQPSPEHGTAKKGAQSQESSNQCTGIHGAGAGLNDRTTWLSNLYSAEIPVTDDASKARRAKVGMCIPLISPTSWRSSAHSEYCRLYYMHGLIRRRASFVRSHVISSLAWFEWSFVVRGFWVLFWNAELGHSEKGAIGRDHAEGREDFAMQWGGARFLWREGGLCCCSFFGMRNASRRWTTKVWRVLVSLCLWASLVFASKANLEGGFQVWVRSDFVCKWCRSCVGGVW